MNVFKGAMIASLLFAAVGSAQAQTAVQVDPERIPELAACQSKTLAQANAYKGLSALMRGSQRVALDETTKVFMDRTADSFSTYADTLVEDASAMDGLARRIFEGSNGYDSYSLVVARSAGSYLFEVVNGAFGLPPSSAQIEDLAIQTAGCNDLVRSIRDDLAHPQD